MSRLDTWGRGCAEPQVMQESSGGTPVPQGGAASDACMDLLTAENACDILDLVTNITYRATDEALVIYGFLAGALWKNGKRELSY